MRRRSKSDTAAIENLYKAGATEDGATVGLVDRLDADALRGCRALSTALHVGARDTREPAAVLDAVGERLAQLLHATPVAGAADPFLALVELGGGDMPGLERARRTAPHFERFMTSIASTQRRSGPVVPIERALRDRDALEAYLAAGGLGDHARRLAREVAEDSILLVAGEGRSRLGGPALLPPDAARPELDGSPLVFLAGIDLSELPAASLPDAGWLLFFGATDADEADFDEPGAGVVLFAPEPVQAAPSQGDLELRHVVAERYLTLPLGEGMEAAAGLDALATQTYEELVDPLWEPFRDLGHHWIGGHVTGAQFTVDDTGTRLLLHVEDDDGLGFDFLDAGTLQFRIPPDALAERDWSRVLTIADSC
jgi:hypothetical protein